LRKYIVGFTSPYPYNTVLFDQLATSIDWNAVDENRVRQFRVFGRFLQTHKFSRPLTWEAIEEALPPLQHAQRRKPKMIRSCLLDLGHLLVARGEMESREAYTRRRNALGYIQQAPEYIRPLLQRYAAWLWERQTVMRSVGSHLKVLASFWSWCDQRGIRSPAEVHTTPINDYLLTLYWQWQCLVCQNTIIFDPHDREAPGACDYCGAISSFNKVKRYVQNAVRQYRAKLSVFFDWAKLNHIVIANPVLRKAPAPSPTIRHYTPEVIKNLCTYIIAPDAHPVEALILYLIIFHALSVWELRHAQLSNLTPLHGGIALPSLAEVYHIHIPKPEPSLGDRTPGRPNVQVSFPIQATQWLKPLLERYEHHRQQKVKDPNNRYLLFSPISSRHNIPVGEHYVCGLVRQASQRVLGKACNANTLRKTVGVMFTDRSGAGVLRFMGWDSQQAFRYYWAERIIIHPQELNVMES
jgi:integrase